MICNILASTVVYSFLLVGRRAFLQTTGTSFTSMALSTKASGDDRQLKKYFQLVVDSDGGTSMVTRTFQNVEEKGYAKTPQLVTQLDNAFGVPTDVVFTQLMGENPWHHCPAPQFVICLAGGWYVKTNDGNTVNLLPGDVLFQDNTENHPAAKENTKNAQHYSGSLNGEPCDQMIVQLDLRHGPIGDSKNAPQPI
ncbi:predicted protein [Phaeodactylum tricornutum CCAP 1055/1]|jgi:quercetin dioxygenase-like cupin family protein|uniref:Uncharacterized protein n=2 Tax=Phaeodactylum tricornutum TaxID=2850 RepID=B5Y3V8_PHATC|nr:predicted protein [Phaeodactylum tricornutum CCAP 1055/1]ACI65193.1 predicted protein [Phaeodactylum tricornutum CCAP 1055/1]|eukprot:XP_002185723.1 predicted protein [Phaeodactylum tricornutum CCAP 1055/1]